MMSQRSDTDELTFVALQTGLANVGWQQAWIEIIDSIGPLNPTPPET